MSESAQNLMQAAHAALDTAAKPVDHAFSHLKALATVDGRLSGKVLDDLQLASYELAFCAAELSAGRYALEYAEKIAASVGNTQASIEDQLAVTFVAEILHSIRSRLEARTDDYGLSREELAQTLDDPTVTDFCHAYLSAKWLQNLGQLVIEHHGVLGASPLDDEKEMIRDTFRRVANDVVAPLAEHIHREDLIIPDAILNALRELGCFGLSIPARFGGIQPDDREDSLGMIVVTEELSRGSLAAAGSLITRPEIMARALMKGGTEAQKAHWLPRLADADPLCAICITEPNYGSDVAGMQFKATKTDGGWLLSGNKTWCTFGGKAGVLLTLARTNPDPKAGHKGLSMFLVEKPSSDGHEFEHVQDGGGSIKGKAIPTIGYRGMHSFDVFFDNFFVPDSHLLGGPEGENKGFYFTMAGFSGGRIQTAARATGLMQAAFERALSYSDERKVFGQALGDYQLTQVKLARMAAVLSASRQFTYAVGGLLDEGKGQMEASLVKLYTCRAAQWLSSEALQLHGGMGYAEESAVSRYWVDSRVLSIFEGAEETLALKVIARSLIEQAA